MGWKDFCWTNHDCGSRELWETRPEKGQRCRTLNFEKSGKMLLAHLDFSARKPPPACFFFLFILWNKETWLALLANKSDCTKTLHDSISSSSQKKHDTEKPWIAAKHSSQSSMGFPAAEFYGFFATLREYLVWAVLPEGPMWHKLILRADRNHREHNFLPVGSYGVLVFGHSEEHKLDTWNYPHVPPPASWCCW